MVGGIYDPTVSDSPEIYESRRVQREKQDAIPLSEKL